jgi:hypothetical protein
MNPLSQEKIVLAALAAATALLLAAAPANAKPFANQNPPKDAVDRAVAAQSGADSGTIVLRKSGTVVVVDPVATATRPDDRAVPRPAPVATVTSLPAGDDGTEWGDVAMGALGGFGIAVFLIGGTMFLMQNRRHDGGVAVP